MTDGKALEAVAFAIETTAHIIAEGGEDDGIANPEECARSAITALSAARAEAGFVEVPVLELRVEISTAAESLMGIAGAIQRGELDGRQDQCYRTRDRLLKLMETMLAKGA